ncbi:MAG: hypothetical protein VX498_12610, partial [Myxococcota bacterium]|nr:hypothetical protein [Myxococcota bacterium]
DAMDDVWELAWGLDPSRNDGGEDPDLDGRSNRQEYRDRSDPLDRSPDPGCAARLGGADPGGLSRGGALTCALGLLLAGLGLYRGRLRQDRGRQAGRPTASRLDDAGTELSG